MHSFEKHAEWLFQSVPQTNMLVGCSSPWHSITCLQLFQPAACPNAVRLFQPVVHMKPKIQMHCQKYDISKYIQAGCGLAVPAWQSLNNNMAAGRRVSCCSRSKQTQTNTLDGCYLDVADASANGLAVPACRNNSLLQPAICMFSHGRHNG